MDPRTRGKENKVIVCDVHTETSLKQSTNKKCLSLDFISVDAPPLLFLDRRLVIGDAFFPPLVLCLYLFWVVVKRPALSSVIGRTREDRA